MRTSLTAVAAIVVATIVFVCPGCHPNPVDLGSSDSQGNGSPLKVPGDHRCSITAGDFERTFLLHVPPGYDGSRPMPLVLVFHGGGGSGEGIAERTGFSSLADREGFLVAYPDDMTDSVMVDFLLDGLIREWRVDRSRVYATGLSNGAVFIHQLARDLQGRFAALAPVAGTMDDYLDDSFYLNAPVPILIIHGTADQVIPWDGRPDLILSVSETVATWVAANYCEPDLDVAYLPDADPSDGTRVRVERYRPEGDPRWQDIPGREVVFYAVEGGGHTWRIWATEAIWQFFQTASLGSRTVRPGKE